MALFRQKYPGGQAFFAPNSLELRGSRAASDVNISPVQQTTEAESLRPRWLSFRFA